MPTGRQIRAARMLLEWDAKDLAKLTGLTNVTIFNIELGKFQARDASIEKIVRAFNQHGVEFVGEHGVQYIQHQVRTLVGVEGLKTFFEDVRRTARETEDDIYICGFSEDYFEKRLGDFIDIQRKEMASIPHVRMKCLIEEGDINIGASSYCQYRWQPKENFTNVPFYIYGDRTAIIATSAPENPLILIIHNRSIAEAYRKQFNGMWDASLELPDNGDK